MQEKYIAVLICIVILGAVVTVYGYNTQNKDNQVVQPQQQTVGVNDNATPSNTGSSCTTKQGVATYKQINQSETINKEVSVSTPVTVKPVTNGTE